MKVIRERDIERYLVERAQALGGEVRKLQWLGRRSAPDRVVMLPARTLASTLDCAWCNPRGRTIWVELKAPHRKPSFAQAREHARMQQAGQEVHVIDSFAGVDALFAGVERGLV